MNNKDPKIMIIDDFDSIITIDRTVNSSFVSFLSAMKVKRIPIICISSIEIMRRIGSIKNKCQIIELKNPDENDLFQTLHRLFPNCSNLKNVIRNNDNLSQCIKQIEYSETQFFDNMDDLINVNILYGNEFNRKNITKTVLTDPWVIPLRFHENMIIELKNRKINISKCHQLYKSFLLNFILYDVMIILHLKESNLRHSLSTSTTGDSNRRHLPAS
jgi:hypothetical protein